MALRQKLLGAFVVASIVVLPVTACYWALSPPAEKATAASDEVVVEDQMTKECGYYEDSTAYRKCVDEAGTRIAFTPPAKARPVPAADPYARMDLRAERRNAMFNDIALARWAYECHVISLLDLNAVHMEAMKIYEMPYGGANIDEPDLYEKARGAVRQGIAAAKAQGCAHWTENPSEVSDMRTRATLAAP